jgi:hypothetical protein
MERGAVRVLNQSDQMEVASIPESGAQAVSPRGDRLVIEGWRTIASGGMEAYADLYDGSTATRLDEVILQTTSFVGDVGPFFRSALTADGASLITHTGQRLFAVDGDRFEEIRIPALTPLALLAPAQPLRALGSAGSAVLDVADPTAPSFGAGGAYQVPIQLQVALEERTGQILFGARFEDPSRAGVGQSWEPNPLDVQRWSLDASGVPQVTGSFLLPNDGAGELLTSGNWLYRMRLPVTPSFDVTLQGWPLSALGRGGELALPAFEILLSPSPPLGAPTGSRSWSAFDVDANANTAVVVTGMLNRGGALFWLDAATTAPHVVEEVHWDSAPAEVRVSGTRAVVTTHTELLWFERGKGLVARVTPPANPYIAHLLGFDGRFAYYSLWPLAAGAPLNAFGVAAFGPGGAIPSPLPLADGAQSLVQTAGALVLGLPSEIVTLQPFCQ